MPGPDAARSNQAGIIGVTDRRHGGEPIERAAQDYDDQPRIAASAARANFGPGPRRSRKRRRTAARRDVADAIRLAAIHCHLLWNSGDITEQSQRSPPRSRADGPPRFRRGGVGRDQFEQIAGIDGRPVEANCADMSSRSLMPSGAARAALCSKPFGLAGDQQGLAQHVEAVEIAALDLPGCAPARRLLATRN